NVREPVAVKIIGRRRGYNDVGAAAAVGGYDEAGGREAALDAERDVVADAVGQDQRVIRKGLADCDKAGEVDRVANRKAADRPGVDQRVGTAAEERDPDADGRVRRRDRAEIGNGAGTIEEDAILAAAGDDRARGTARAVGEGAADQVDRVGLGAGSSDPA